MNIAEIKQEAAARKATCAAIRQMLVTRLDLPIDPDWITDDQPLFGRGLELDSLDVLELLVAIEAEYGVSLYDHDTAIFSSVSTLADFVDPSLRTSSAVTVTPAAA
jgi:acyl carrier protein